MTSTKAILYPALTWTCEACGAANFVALLPVEMSAEDEREFDADWKEFRGEHEVVEIECGEPADDDDEGELLECLIIADKPFRKPESVKCSGCKVTAEAVVWRVDTRDMDD